MISIQALSTGLREQLEELEAAGWLADWLQLLAHCDVQNLGHADRPGLGTMQDSVILPNMYSFLREEGRPI